MKVTGLREVNKVLNGIVGQSKQASKNVLKRTGDSISTAGNKSVRESYTVKSSDLKKTISVRQKGDSEVDMIVKGRNLALPKFKISPKAPVPKEKSKPVKVAVKKGATKKLKGSFLATMSNGHVGSYQRTPGVKAHRKRNAKGSYPSLPIDEQKGPGTPIMMNNPKVITDIEDKAQEVIEKRVEHEFMKRIFK